MDLFCDLNRIAITEVRCGGFLDGMSYEGEEKKTRRGGRVFYELFINCWSGLIMYNWHTYYIINRIGAYF